jgi:predicted nuclease of predicted toxin-antitoxin system
MKILLDENLDHRLRNHLGPHDVYTASYKGWDGLKNGNLIRVAEDDGFDLLLTGDQTLCNEQNLSGKRLAIIAMSSVEWRIVKSHLPQIIAAIDNATPGSFQTVDCGTFSRKSRSEE